MRINKIIAVALISLLSLTACIKETFPTSFATTEQVGSSSSALEAMVSAIPAQMVQGYLIYGTQTYEYDMAYPGLMMMLDGNSGDIVVNGDNGGNWYAYWCGLEYTVGPTRAIAYVPWRTFYMFIKSANDVISAVDPSSANQTQLAYLGQALAVRAFCYMQMACIYEWKQPTDPSVSATYKPENDITGLTVPWVSGETEDGSNNPRISVGEMYEKVFADLDAAENYLKDYTATSTLLPDLAVVYGLKARAYMQRGSAGEAGAFGKAAEYAKAARTAFGGSPLTQDQWENPTTGFNNAAANANSWMWNLQYSAETMGNLCNFVGHMSAEATWSYGVIAARGINKTLYSQIPDTDWRKHTWIDPAGKKYYDYKLNRDVFSGSEALPAYTSLKFRPVQGNCNDYSVGGVSDVPLMRIEEMYFIEAEALAMSGDLSSGKNVLSELMLTRNPKYDISSIPDAELFQKEVFRQKRIEFWGEGVIFFDCKRLAAGFHTNDSGTNVQEGYRYDVDGIFPAWNWCIPQSELNGNTALQGYNNPDPTKSVPELSNK